MLVEASELWDWVEVWEDSELERVFWDIWDWVEVILEEWGGELVDVIVDDAFSDDELVDLVDALEPEIEIGEVCFCVVCPEVATGLLVVEDEPTGCCVEVPAGLVCCVEGELGDVGLVCGTFDVDPLLEDCCTVLDRLVKGGLVLEEGTTVLFGVVAVWTGFGLEGVDADGTFVAVVVTGWLEDVIAEVVTALVGAMEAAVVASLAKI
ncbi:hypothetical protein WR25_04538 [Diploscapter pachys]|uniref:Uncharacterized protein n=1 Tax=Diploscapter pachys TaxID=2018661 RepID=A0A2A2LG00_9BILA|nr:hypothetical protein WR25_04538 [Diploscapter pachys]